MLVTLKTVAEASPSLKKLRKKKVALEHGQAWETSIKLPGTEACEIREQVGWGGPRLVCPIADEKSWAAIRDQPPAGWHRGVAEREPEIMSHDFLGSIVHSTRVKVGSCEAHCERSLHLVRVNDEVEVFLDDWPPRRPSGAWTGSEGVAEARQRLVRMLAAMRADETHEFSFVAGEELWDDEYGEPLAEWSAARVPGALACFLHQAHDDFYYVCTIGDDARSVELWRSLVTEPPEGWSWYREAQGAKGRQFDPSSQILAPSPLNAPTEEFGSFWQCDLIVDFHSGAADALVAFEVRHACWSPGLLEEKGLR